MKRLFALLACWIVCGAALAQPVVRDANKPATLQAAAQARALMDALVQDMDRQDAAFDAGTRDAATRAKWSEQERVDFLRRMLRSPSNQVFDRKIAALTAELQSLQQVLVRGEVDGAQADARFVARMGALVGQLRSVYQRQSDYLLGELRAVKPAQRR